MNIYTHYQYFKIVMCDLILQKYIEIWDQNSQ